MIVLFCVTKSCSLSVNNLFLYNVSLLGLTYLLIRLRWVHHRLAGPNRIHDTSWDPEPIRVIRVALSRSFPVLLELRLCITLETYTQYLIGL